MEKIHVQNIDITLVLIISIDMNKIYISNNKCEIHHTSKTYRHMLLNISDKTPYRQLLHRILSSFPITKLMIHTKPSVSEGECRFLT